MINFAPYATDEERIKALMTIVSKQDDRIKALESAVSSLKSSLLAGIKAQKGMAPNRLTRR